MKKYAIYARKSTESEDRQVLSIDSQVDEMKQLATRLELNVLRTFKESRSASKLGRPVFAEMMQAILDGEIDGILCWKPDRLARNPIDGGQVIWALKESSLVIQTPGQRYSSDSENMIMLYLEFGMAQKYTDDLSKNVKRGNLAKLRQGGWCGLAPMGYLNKLEDHTIVPDPERFPLLRSFWELLLTGNTPEEARKKLNDDWGFRTVVRKRSGGNPLSKTGMYNLIRSKVYCGIVERNVDGELQTFQGSHKPMISEDEFWRVQRLLGNPVPRPQTKNFAYTGLISCAECGGMYTAYEKVKKSGKRYVYYKCTKKNNRTGCKQKQLNLSKIEDQVENILSDMTIPEGWADWAVKWLRHLNEEQSGTSDVVRTSLQNTYNEIQKKIDNLTDMRLQDLLTDEEYASKKALLIAERDGIEEKLKDSKQGSDNWITDVEQVFDFAKSAKQQFDEGDVEVRKIIVRNLGSNFTLLNGKLQLELNDVWKLFSKHSKQLHADMDRVELDELSQPKEKTTATKSVILSWQG